MKTCERSVRTTAACAARAQQAGTEEGSRRKAETEREAAVTDRFQIGLNLPGHPEVSGLPFSCQLTLVVENDIEQRTVDLQSAFRTASVVNEAQLPESVHEKADP